MSDAVFMDFSEPDDRPVKPKVVAKVPKAPIPIPPEPVQPITSTEIKRGVSERSRSAANLKVEGYTYDEIARILEFPSATDARRAVESVLAAIHGPGDYDTLRLVVTARAELQLKRSLGMAGADFLVDQKTGKRLPNPEKLRWHQQASVDLMNYAIITGAKAPTKVEITPGEADMETLVSRILSRQGHEDIVDAEVIEMDAIEAPIHHYEDDRDD